MKRIVIIGGGFAGMWASLAASRENLREKGEIDIALISRDEHLTLRPRLYERNPRNMRTPLRDVLQPAGVVFHQGEVRSIDTQRRLVDYLEPNGGGQSMPYDRLVLAAGSVLRQPPVPGLQEHGWNVDSYEASVALDDHLSRIAAEAGGRRGEAILIVGAGFTGIELATEMRDRLLDLGGLSAAVQARVILLDQAPTVGPELGENPRPVIERALAEARVELRLGRRLQWVDEEGATLEGGERISTRTVVLAAGMEANRLTRELPVARDEQGRIITDRQLRAEGLSEVFAAGDAARAQVDDEHVALMSCQHAITMGKFAGCNAARDLLGLSLKTYRQPDYVTCLDLGGSGAVFTSGWDRQVVQVGWEAKQLKRQINRQWIYPPQGTREEILSQAAPESQSKAKQEFRARTSESEVPA